MSDILDLPEGATRSKHPWKENIVEDPETPKLFSPQAIFGFSIVYTVLAGAVLLAINARLLKARLWILAYGLVGAAIPVGLVYLTPAFSLVYFVVNAVLCFGLVPYLWNKSVGANTKFRVRSVWFLVLILVILPLLFSFGIIDLILYELGFEL
jgi:hypothetical protein